MLSPPSEMPARLMSACNHRARTVHLYTLLQLLVLAVVWMVNISPLGLCVSFVIVALVPFRERVMPLLFDLEALAALDAPDEAFDTLMGAPDESMRASVDGAPGPSVPLVLPLLE